MRLFIGFPFLGASVAPTPARLPQRRLLEESIVQVDTKFPRTAKPQSSSLGRARYVDRSDEKTDMPWKHDYDFEQWKVRVRSRRADELTGIAEH